MESVGRGEFTVDLVFCRLTDERLVDLSSEDVFFNDCRVGTDARFFSISINMFVLCRWERDVTIGFLEDNF